MPICKRDGFDSGTAKNKEQTFHDNDEVFFCEVTKEIFRDYEDYFRHVMAINSTVWQCEATGRENLTYAEALKSERRARKKMELFKDSLRPPVMLVIEQAKQSSIKALHAIIFKFVRRRFFIKEEVTAMHKSSKYYPYTVVAIVPPGKSPPANGVYEDTDKLRYKLQLSGDGAPSSATPAEITVPFENIRRQRFEFTSDNLQMFIKNNVTRIDGILKPKTESYKKYVTDRQLTFASLFIGKMPHFTPAKIKRPTDAEHVKKQLSMNKYLVKGAGSDEKSVKKLSAQEQTKREEEREQKARSLKEDMERVRREKQERLAELERQKAEKRTQLMEKIEAECTALLTKTDDLERSDQYLLPKFVPVQTCLPAKLLGDAFMLREFLHSFSSLLTGLEALRGNLSFYEMARAFTQREVAGPLSDIVRVLLGTIFDLQKEEEEDYSVDYLLLRKELRHKEPQYTMSQASRAHIYAKRHFSLKIHELPLDALTVSEVLRLHLLSSGACVRDRVEKMRLSYRNGYTSSEDPGLALRLQHPHLLRALKMYTFYQLPLVDIMRVLRCLMSQILTYGSTLTVIEDRMEQMARARNELRTLATSENRRQTHLQAQKRLMTNEYHQQCLGDDVRKDAEKKRQLETKFNKRVAEHLAQSERDRKKHEQQLDKLQGELFNFLVYLGMDRAYRKYYVFESMPGLFVEHPVECYDVCLSEPPVNLPPSALLTKSADLPKNRKDLRSFLLKKYTDEEKAAQHNHNNNNNTNNNNNSSKKLSVGSENKENQELVNGLTNGHDDALKVDTLTPAPTQYELFMCTGDRHNCIVHDERNADRQRWAYLYQPEDIDALIESLNPLGERESKLREQLTTLRKLILHHVKKCPVEILSLESKPQLMRFKNNLQMETQRRYSKANFGFEANADLDEVMYMALLERILQFEQDIYTGDLGRLKVKDMPKWRQDLQQHAYDAQGKLQWGVGLQSMGTVSNGAANAEQEEDIDEYADDDELDEAHRDSGGRYANKPFVDPGADLGETLEIDSEDSGDETISLHDSPTLRLNVKHLASALLQVEQSIERRFLKEPFGAPLKETKDKELLERKMKVGVERLKQWEVSLMESTSYSQVFLHLNLLHDAIVWARSTSKSYCQVCRRGSDPEKMLLCDECNGGTHMFCMKPKMKTVPDGNWYCARCVNRLGLQNASKTKATSRRRRHIEVEEEPAVEEDNADSRSDTSSTSHIQRNGRRSNRRLRPDEIELLVEHEGEDEEVVSELTEEAVDQEDAEEEEVEEDENEGDDVEADVEEECSHHTNSAMQSEADNDDDVDVKKDEQAEEEENDDENVCIVCLYDGADLMCVRCKDICHLECVNLKRPPRYNFVCAGCKVKDDRKRKLKGSSEEDDTDFTDTSDPPQKRLRQGRSSLRNSLPNGTQNVRNPNTNTSSSSRRSHRRTGEDLPLNSPALYELLDDVMKHEQAWPFLRPVMQSEVPDYYYIIKHPMDLAKVKSKLNMGEYQLNEEVMNDIQLVFNNCDQYNVKGNEIYEAGAALERFVIERCKRLKLPFIPSDMNA